MGSKSMGVTRDMGSKSFSVVRDMSSMSGAVVRNMGHGYWSSTSAYRWVIHVLEKNHVF